MIEDRRTAGGRGAWTRRGALRRRGIRLAALALALALAAPAAAQPSDERCTTLEACTEALEGGRYEVAEAGLERLRRGRDGARAAVALGRVYLATGRYEEAADLARPLSRRGDARVAAATLLGEAEMARGRLDEAQQAFEAVIGEASAHRARVMLGRLLMRRGREQAAQMPLMALIQAYNDETIGDDDAAGLAYVAMAAVMLDSPHDANDAFQQSTRADDTRVETQLEWARLFLSKYDTGHAEESVTAALEHNPNSAVGRALLARIKLEQSLDFVAAQRELDRALEIDPNLVMAHVTRAGIAIRDMDLDAAQEHLDRALAIDPNDLEALSVRAALRFLQDDDAAYERAVRETLQRNPRYSEMYTIIADYADWEHRYPQIVEMAREALRIDPDDALAHATLGINLLRMGQEEEGLEALREAWRRDRFNVRVYNTLNLFDDVLGQEYERVEAAPFVFRMHTEERPVMERYVTETLRRAYRDMRRRYGFTPQTPIHIEMFSDPQHFSVRTSGLPNVGVQGVCFGQVITALSPRGGPFNWAQITWHELAHVFHIQMSNNRVPRWFTEGLAEYETIIARPEWHREQDHRLYRAMRSGRVPPVRQLNHAFTHARSGEDMTVAYYASSMLVKYIAERFGFDRVVRMLREWGRGRSTDEVIQRALGISVDELDRDFRRHTEQRLADRADDFAVDYPAYRDLDRFRERAAQHPDDADAQAALAASLMVNGELEEATEAMHRALRLDRNQPVARFTAARLALTRRDARTARADLRLLIESGHDGYEPRLLQARLFMSQRDARLARRALEAAARIDPERPEAWQGLMQIARRTDDDDLRFRALRRLADIDQHDRTANRALLAELAERGEWDLAREYGERGVLVDPLHAESHRLYAEALIRADEHAEALREADTALAAEPEEPGPVHLTRARALRGLRRMREAREAAEAAVSADPSLREAAGEITGR
ncbi:MAG TPA: tetratricopeptide repeat protein [Sandaracinaceae bacterium LLY-WYZ-13_1]|nr:tetratricopeptide repeat protein [Sandaracinaceae bacterium LLY-WYZ-13_1]